MSIASMTGFAREAGVTGAYQWAWELKTVNGRGLEVRVRTPSGLDAVGEEARGQILKALTRGWSPFKSQWQCVEDSPGAPAALWPGGGEA